MSNVIEPKNNEELKKMIVDGVINCQGKNLICDFNIDVEADINNALDIKASNIDASNIDANDINALDIKASNINAEDINAYDINAYDINANDINAIDINAWNIKASNINALDIEYYAVCFAYKNITCKSIKGTRTNAKHFCLDGKITIKD